MTPSGPGQCRIITGIGELSDNYQGFLIDAWGVLHDGHSVYPGAIDCLERLQAQHKPVLIMSNAARREEAMIRELKDLNIEPTLYHSVLSSGELAWQSLRQATHDENVTNSCGYYLGPKRSRGLLEGLDITWIDEIERADFILNAGAPEGNPVTTERWDELLLAAAARDIPMICANPDLCAIRAGEFGVSAGAFAARYQQLGANHIAFHGKPYKAIYDAAGAILNGIPPSCQLAIGDAFATDIQGGCNAGLDTCLIAAGIHREALTPLSAESLSRCRQEYPIPTFASEHLVW